MRILGLPVTQSGQYRGDTVSGFFERVGECKISVDLLNRTTPDEAAAKARLVGVQRSLARNFYGWAVVGAEQVRKAGCGVEQSPLLDNP